jgi:hypothetical protein
MNDSLAFLHIMHVKKHAQAAEDAIRRKDYGEALKHLTEVIIDAKWAQGHIVGT